MGGTRLHLPAILFLVAFVAYPLIWSFWLSFTDYNLLWSSTTPRREATGSSRTRF